MWKLIQHVNNDARIFYPAIMSYEWSSASPTRTIDAILEGNTISARPCSARQHHLNARE